MATASESILASTAFGTVTDKRVTYFRNKGWFSGGSQQDVPLRHITSVRVDITRSLIGGLVWFLIGIGLLFGADSAAKLICIVPLALGVLFLWGSPKVIVNTSGGDLNVATSWPWTREEAESFAQSLRSQLFKD